MGRSGGRELPCQPAEIYRKSGARGEREWESGYTFNPAFTPRFSPFHNKANNSSPRDRESLLEQLWGKKENVREENKGKRIPCWHIPDTQQTFELVTPPADPCTRTTWRDQPHPTLQPG